MLPEIEGFPSCQLVTQSSHHGPKPATEKEHVSLRESIMLHC